DEVAADPQAEARAMFPVVEHPAAGAVKVTGAPVKLSQTPGAIESAAPLLGQHTRQALQTLLSISDQELESLIREGVVKASA
ncbi:MAG: CoA transferase, partial [Bryobacterales bacterium]|nr:CoA transferase [Bryobacterales bacterium]